MMDLSEWKLQAIHQLQTIYGTRESTNIIRWLLEDLGVSTHYFNDYEHQLNEALNRLLTGEPVQYVTGFAWFCGLKLQVNSHVLIPRPETEELVYIIHDYFKDTDKKKCRVLDIGTGSGCIALGLKKFFPDWTISGLDQSSGALDVAKHNAGALGMDIALLEIDILDPQHHKHIIGPWDIIVSNPPYIPIEDQHLLASNVLNYEPHQALFTNGADGMEFYVTIAEFAEKYLSSNGCVFLEIHEDRANAITELFIDKGFQCTIQKDLQGKNRFVLIY